MRRHAVALLLAATIALSVVAPAAAVGGSLVYGDTGKAPSPYASADLTISEKRVSDGDSLLYQNDNSEWAEFPGELNTSDDVADLGTDYVNPWSFHATDIDDSQFGEFPRKDTESNNSASAFDASEYTTGANATVTDVTTAPNVDAVEVSFADTTGGPDDNTATYGNFSVTSDAEKRHFAMAYDIVSAGGASTITATVHDATDGDTVTVELYNSVGDTSTDDTFATTTGDGKLGQVQLGAVGASGGDGSLDEIGKVVYNADGSAEIEASLIDLERTSKYNLGTERVDTDSDDDFETNTVYSATGEINIRSIESMGSSFDDASIRDVTVPVHAPASLQADADVDAQFDDAEQYPSFDSVLNVTYRMELPDQFDLSYANVELRLDQNWNNGRFVTAEYAEAVGDSTDLRDVSDSSYSSFSGSLGSAGTSVTIDSTVSPGDDNVVHLELKLTGDEANAMQTSTGSSGGGAIFGGGSGGPVDFILSVPGIIVSSIAAFVGGRAAGVF
jgi:hypothetical protein